MTKTTHLDRCRKAFRPSGVCEYDERLKVTDDEAGEEHKAEFTTRRLDDRRIEVLQESHDDPTRRADAGHGHRGRHDRERAVPAHVLLGESETATTVVGRPPTARARLASVLVLDVGVRLARCAHPATGVALLDSFDVTDVTRPATL